MDPVVELRPGFLAAAVRRRWRFVFGCGLAGLLVVAGLIQLRGPSYTATAVVLVNPLAGNPYSPTTSPLRTEQLNSLETEAALVSTQAVSKRAVARSGGTLGEGAGDQVSVTVVPAATVLRISFTGGSAAKASTGAQSFAEAYLGYRQAQAEAAIKRQLDGIEERTAETQSALDEAQRKVAEAGTTSQRTILESEATAYSSQLGQLEIERVDARNSARNPGQVISPAAVPTSADGLPRWLLLAGGLIAGLAIGVMICLWREHNDDRVREPEDVSALGLPRMLAVVPPASGRSMFEVSTTEGFQLLRSSMLARLPRQAAVISICPVGTRNRSGEFGFALAAALDRSGRRMVLVLSQTGTDSPYVWVRPGPGLTDVLLNPGLGEHLDELLHRLSDNLWVLPPGRMVREVADVYQSPAMDDVIRRLRGLADIVLVAAPDLGSAAGRTLAGVGDGVLLMIGMTETRHGTLMDAYDELAFRNVGVIGVVGVTRGRRRRERKPTKGGAEITLDSRLATRAVEPRPPAPVEPRPPAPVEPRRQAPVESALAPPVAPTAGTPGRPEPVDQPVRPVPPPKSMQPPRRAPLLRPAQPNGPPPNGAGQPETAAAPGEAEPSDGAADAASADAATMTLPKMSGNPAEPIEPSQPAEPAVDQSTDGEPARTDGKPAPSGDDESGDTRPQASSGRAEAPAATPPR